MLLIPYLCTVCGIAFPPFIKTGSSIAVFMCRHKQFHSSVSRVFMNEKLLNNSLITNSKSIQGLYTLNKQAMNIEYL